MIRSEIRSRILDGLNDASGVFVTSAQANTSIDEALEVLAEESGAIIRTAFLAMLPGTMYYWLSAIASDVMAPIRVWDVERQWRLTAVSMRELDQRHETWPTVQRDPEVWFPVSWDLFGVWPAAAAGGGVLRVDYLAWPRALLDDSDEPEFQVGDHDALVDYGVYEGLMKRWDAKRALEAWGQFGARAGISKARTGAGRVHARAFRVGRADVDPGFTTGIER